MTDFVHYQSYHSYRLGTVFAPNQKTLDRLLSLLESSPARTPMPLEGRRSVLKTDLPETGPVVVKFYARGGVLRHLNREKYLRLGASRARKEFAFLQAAAAAGVSVPEPVAFATRGALFYRAWLISRAVSDPQTLAALSRVDPDRAQALLPLIAENIRKLIFGAIYHVDLHPGNILIDDREAVYIIDFDRARFFTKSTRQLWKRYQRRWQRAVIKHRVPAFLEQALTKRLIFADKSLPS